MTSDDLALEENNSWWNKILTIKDEQIISGYKYLSYFDKEKHLYPMNLSADICLYQSSQIFEKTAF